MKKISAYFVVFVMLVSLFSGCEKHEHLATAQWDRDAVSHWHPCACGEKMDVAPHVMEGETCTGCGSIISTGYGRIDVDNYNEYGDPVRSTYYIVEDEIRLLNDFVKEYEYDDAGNLKSKTILRDGEFYGFVNYYPNSIAEDIVSSSTYFDEDRYATYDYDVHGNMIRRKFFDKYGKLVEDGYFLHEMGDDGYYYTCLATLYYPEENQKIIQSSDDRGRDLWEMVYEGDMLREERYYTFVSDPDKGISGSNLVSKEIFYEEDGSYTVKEYVFTVRNGGITSGARVYVYDQNGKLIEYRNGY